jgi:phage head maturation protease
MKKIITPSSLRRLAKEKRFARVGGSPRSYDPEAHTVEAVISKGSPVRRAFGTEVLKISPSAVDVSRVSSGGLPLLDSHSQTSINDHLGRITKTWFTRDALMGLITFNDSKEGHKAEGMVSRGEIAGISAGYTVSEWEIKDASGRVLDPEHDRISFDDDLTFTATRWALLEASLVSVPADADATIRSFGSAPTYVRDARARMAARQRMIGRMR